MSDRIEIYLSQSREDRRLLEIWKRMSLAGRGRRQDMFRRMLVRGLASLDDIDIPEEVRDTLSGDVNVPAPVKPAVRKTSWKPEPVQVETVRKEILPAEEAVEVPEVKTVPDEPAVDAGVDNNSDSVHNTGSVDPETLEEWHRIQRETEPTPEILGFEDDVSDDGSDDGSEKRKSAKKKFGGLM